MNPTAIPVLEDILKYNIPSESFFYEDKWYQYDNDFNFIWFENLFNRNDTFNIIDIGAFDGGDSLRYKLYFPNANVYSIEADPILYKELKKIKKYDIKTFNCAITDNDSMIDFYTTEFKHTYKSSYNIPSNGSPIGSILEHSDEFKQQISGDIIFKSPIKIQGFTLDTFCHINNINKIGFAHIDVEGAGKQVISGMKNILPTLLWIEIHNVIKLYKGAATEQEINDILFPLGYFKIAQTNTNNLYYKNRKENNK
jgi:FkbM family methyltransferase